MERREEALKVLKRLRENPKERPPQLDFSRLSLVGEDFSGLDLSGADFSYSNLSGANFSQARLFGASFKKASLRGANLEEAELFGADLSEADLEGVKAEKAGFGKARLEKARLFRAHLPKSTFTKAYLGKADLRLANLARARMREVDLSEADCAEASFIGADLSLSRVREANFYNADFRGARLRSLKDYEKASWIGVDIRGINLAGAYMLRRFIMDQNFLKEFKERSRFHHLVYYLWWLTSDCGRSMTRWFICILVEVILFGLLYELVKVDYGPHRTWLSPFYYSLVTITTLGYGDVVPASLGAQIIAMIEVLTGYLMLGGLLSLFANKLARRAD